MIILGKNIVFKNDYKLWKKVETNIENTPNGQIYPKNEIWKKIFIKMRLFEWCHPCKIRGTFSLRWLIDGT